MKGAAGFEQYYLKVFGERWNSLKEALAKPAQQVARLNAFVDPAFLKKRWKEEVTQLQGVSFVAGVKDRPPEADGSGLLDVYWMDLASILPVLALEPKPGERILDMCAAPGGKSLITFELMKGQGQLAANEVSDNRRGRLKAVFHDYVPASLMKNIEVTGHDAGRWCLYEKEAFDRILLDAPCSGERHILNDIKELRAWSPARSKNLAVRQYTLLASALQVVKPGGRIVYSTCALSPLENDLLISRLIQRKGESFSLERVEFALGEATEHGWMVSPDKHGYGPIYLSVLTRKKDV